MLRLSWSSLRRGEDIPKEHFAGIDVGASATKCMIIDDKGSQVSFSVARSGVDLEKRAAQVFQNSLNAANLKADAVTRVISTGFGRNNVSFAHGTRTEISCQSRGCFHHFPRAMSIVDIGGQDTKIIVTTSKGKLKNFRMNRKCAAGTGTFLEEIALKLDIPLDEMNLMARRSEERVEIGSYCTVFTATEILSKIREGIRTRDIVKGVYGSVVKRVMEMDPLTGDVVLTGGVIAHNDVLIDLFEEALGRPVYVPPNPQFTGAFGAALFALERKNSLEEQANDRAKKRI